MPIVVQKYGGSSVANLEKLRRVAERVVATRSAGNDVVVVVSAMGDTTDDLLHLAREVHPNPSRRELDMLLSVGERISMALLSLAVQRLGCDAISFTGSQSGIITDESHANARIIEVRPQRIRESLAEGKVVIVAGYQGVSRAREVTTLGRGGSDTSAVALAAALGAERCEILSDVDGVFTADPRVVPEARRLDGIGCEEMQELAIWGAKVLNAEAVELARRAGISIVAAAAHAPGPGTRVGAGAPPWPGLACGVAVASEIAILDFAGDLRDLLARCAQSGVAPRAVRAAEGRVRAVLPLENLHDRSLRDAPGVSWQDGLAAVTAVGRCLLASGGLTAGALALAAAGIAVAEVDASDLRVTFFVSQERAVEAARVLHAALVEHPR
jgi:aspartate kinase